MTVNRLEYTVLISYTVLFITDYMEDECSGVIDMEVNAIPAGRLLVTRRAKYRNTLSCTVTLRAPVDKRIVIVFR